MAKQEVELTASEFGKASGQTTALTRLYRTQQQQQQQQVFRIQVYRNFYADQSYATLSVLSTNREWTPIFSISKDSWHSSTHTPADYDKIADMLLEVLLKTFS